MKQLLSCAACVLLLAACSKNNNDGPPKEDPAAIKYLTWAGEKNGNTKLDGIAISYNAQNRLESLLQTGGEEGMRKYYDNAGNLITSEVFTEDVLSRLHVHYVNGLPDTAVERYFDRATNDKTDAFFLSYTVENNRVVRIRMEDSAGVKPATDIHVRYTGENVTSILQVPVDDQLDTLSYYEWTYGTKKNPFLASKMKFHVAPTGTALLFQSANDQLTQRFRMPGLDIDEREKYVNQFDASGYPVRQASIVEGETDSTIVYFEYRQ
ncbi:hypothetical protein [Chitinophaga sp.]|uniref:hypothetical protein n=1 Tax=Chitinophaga sp. TaxID=1869181 RepID=UPI00261B434E|nr:hypothetical protein [uncultured Chitinophaga sp.]